MASTVQFTQLGSGGSACRHDKARQPFRDRIYSKKKQAKTSIGMTDVRQNYSTLVSLIVVGADGFSGAEARLEQAATSLRAAFSFIEIIIIADAEDASVRGLIERIARVAPQVRLLQIEGATDFDRMAMHGYQECIGDLIILTTAEELGIVEIAPIISKLQDGEQLVRLRRKTGSRLERTSSVLISYITGMHVDTRFHRTLGMDRQLLSQLLARPEEIHLFRFNANTLFSRQSVLETDQKQERGGFKLMFRRIDLVARLVATSAPRLLRGAGVLSLSLAMISLFTLAYVVGAWLLLEDIVEGWTTIVCLIALWMFVQMSTTSALCLGLSRMLDRQERTRMPRLVNELTVSDLFSSSGLLNVEREDQS